MTREHLTFEELEELARTVPPDDTGSEGLRHVRECAECQYQYVGMRMLTHVVKFRRRTRRRRLLGFAIAGLVFVMVVGGGAYFWSRPQPSLQALATRDTIPESFVVLRFGRGTAISGGSHLLEFRAGVESLARGDYTHAVDTLEGLLEERPGDPEIHAVLGIARYLSGDNSDETMELLESGASHPDTFINRPSRWYLANLHLRRGETERAQESLKGLDLGEIDDRFSRLARDLRARISQ